MSLFYHSFTQLFRFLRRSLALHERISKLLKDAARHFNMPDHLDAYVADCNRTFTGLRGLNLHYEHCELRSAPGHPGIDAGVSAGRLCHLRHDTSPL